MIGDVYQLQAEIIEGQTRIAELSNALDHIREERDNALDAANSLHREVERMRIEVKHLQTVVDRLRLHIQQGVEL
jgi:predicted  nucleic acid-binding Zn-ribbon protein